jgi:hypothetical protein
MGKITLRRYTNLAAAIHILESRSISLLSPILWDDRNDAFFMNSYKEQKSAKSVLALCFAEASETYHHWRVFSHGSDGTCIEFEKGKLLAAFGDNRKIRANTVNYEKIDILSSIIPTTDQLPFLKRYPYQDEKEFRIIYTDYDVSADSKDFGIDLSAIGRISLSPWMPSSLSKSVARTLRSIKGCEKLKVSRSTLIENEKWKAIAKEAQVTS